MADIEKDSTAGGSSAPSAGDVEAACVDGKAPEAAAAAAATPGGKGNRNKWLIGSAVGIMVIVAIVVPTVILTGKPAASEGGATPSSSSEAPGPFNATSNLRLFNEDVVRGYNSTDELKSDVAGAAWFLIEQVVQRNSGVEGYESVGVGQGQRPSQEGDLASSDAASQGQGSNHGAGSDYGTNNQEDLEEGDTIVSDGMYVYSAYSEYLLIWNARNGSLVAQVKMPPVDMGESSTSAAGATGDEMYYYWNPKPDIRNLLLYEGKLLVTVGGYGPSLMRPNGLNESVLYDFLNTQLRVYSTASLVAGNDQPVSTTNLQGAFSGVRAIDGNVHVMTTTGINTYNDLIQPFETDPTVSSSEAYTQEAFSKAQEEAVPQFVEKVVSQIGMGDSGLPKLVKISLFQNELSGVEALTFPSGILNTLALVHSFSLADDSPTLAVASAGAFLPSYWAQFYGSTTHLIIAGQGQRVDAQSSFTVESTNFLSFAISGAAAVAEAVGSVDGYVMNTYAIDVKDDHLRVGVSISNRWFFATDPMPMEGGVAMDTVDSTSTPVASSNSTTENYVLILSLPGLNGAEAGTMEEVGRLKLGKPNELFTALRFYDNVAYAVTFERTDPLYVLDLSVPAAPKILSELNVLGFSSYLHSLNANNTLMLGVGSSADENGTVTGIKLSVFNTKNPAAPFVAAEYVIESGQDKYSSTSAEYDPKALRVVPGMNLIALPIDSWDYASGSHFNGFWTFFVNETQILKECELGHAFNESVYYTDPMPAESGGSAGGTSDPGSGTSSTSDPSSGTSTVIGDPASTACFYCAYMPPRAMVFDGVLMTVNNHFVRGHRLDTCAEAWALDIVVPVDNSTMSGCCSAYA